MNTIELETSGLLDRDAGVQCFGLLYGKGTAV